MNFRRLFSDKKKKISLLDWTEPGGFISPKQWWWLQNSVQHMFNVVNETQKKTLAGQEKCRSKYCRTAISEV